MHTGAGSASFLLPPTYTAGVFAFLYGSERALRNRVPSTPQGRVNNRPLESLPNLVQCHSGGKARPLCDGKRALWARGDAENR